MGDSMRVDRTPETKVCGYSDDVLKRCLSLAEAYDKVPGEERWLCRDHREWSWMGSWADCGWSLRLTPRMSEAQWRDQGLKDALHGCWTNDLSLDDAGYWDINKTIRAFRRHTNRKIEIVLPPPPQQTRKVQK